LEFFESLELVVIGISNTSFPFLPVGEEDIVVFRLLVEIVLLTPVFLLLAPRERVEDARDACGGSSTSTPGRLMLWILALLLVANM